MSAGQRRSWLIPSSGCGWAAREPAEALGSDTMPRTRQRTSIFHDLLQKAPDDAVAGIAQPREAGPRRLVRLLSLPVSGIGKPRLKETYFCDISSPS